VGPVAVRVIGIEQIARLSTQDMPALPVI
jgi:hypothetical protein